GGRGRGCRPARGAGGVRTVRPRAGLRRAGDPPDGRADAGVAGRTRYARTDRRPAVPRRVVGWMAQRPDDDPRSSAGQGHLRGVGGPPVWPGGTRSARPLDGRGLPWLGQQYLPGAYFARVTHLVGCLAC